MTTFRRDLTAVAQKFIDAWNVESDSERRHLLEETCAKEIRVSSPFGEYSGIDRQFEEISQFRKTFPRGRCRTRPISQHHESLLSAFTTDFGTDRPPLTGVDCLQFDERGRVARIVSFSPVRFPP